MNVRETAKHAGFLFLIKQTGALSPGRNRTLRAAEPRKFEKWGEMCGVLPRGKSICKEKADVRGDTQTFFHEASRLNQFLRTLRMCIVRSALIRGIRFALKRMI